MTTMLPRFIKSFAAATILSAVILAIVLITRGISKIGVPAVNGVLSVESSKERVSGKLFSVAIMADCEDDFDRLYAALQVARDSGVRAIFFLGDFTSWGDQAGLQKAKALLDASGFDYYVLPGDHDLAQAVSDGDTSGLKYFRAVFGSNVASVEIMGVKFVLLDNSANYTKVSSTRLAWFLSQLPSADFILLAQPLYHAANPRVMGIVEGEVIDSVRDQAEDLLTKLRESKVKAVIAADQHLFSRQQDPVRIFLEHVVVGALVGNERQLRNPQTPRFVLLSVFKDSSYDIEEVLVP